MEKRKRVLWLWVVFLLCFVLFLKLPTSDPDLGWHLKNARTILDTGRFPLADNYSWTMPGYKYADSWWLSEVLIYKVKGFFGFYGLAFFFAALPAVVLVLFALKKFPKIYTSWLGTITFILAIVLLQPFIGARAQTITLVFFIVLYLFLDKQRASWSASQLVSLFSLFFLWSNLHAGFVMGLLLLAVFVGWQVLGSFNPSGLRSFNPKGLLPLLFIFPPVLAAFINPYGLNLWRTILNDAGSLLIKRNIQEWLPPSPQSEIGALFFILMLVSFALIIFKRDKIPAFDVFLFFIFSFFGIAAVRNISFFGLFFLVIVWKVIHEYQVHEKKYTPSFLYLLGFLLLLVGGVTFYNRGIFNKMKDFQTMITESNLPYEAVEYLKNDPRPDLRLFNEYGWGGYLIWQSDIKTFIDGRMCGWQTEETNVFEDYLKIISLKEGFQEEIKKWDIDAFLIKKASPLSMWLELNPEFKKTHEDDLAVIFVIR